MTEDLKNLIEKIQKEGVQEAEAKAAAIEAEARRRAEAIVNDASQKAKRAAEEAQADIQKKQESTHAALKQTGRDLLLSLKQQIIALLEAVTSREVGQALTPEAMSSLIVELIKNSAKRGDEDIVVTMSKHDAEKLKAGLLHHLKESLKHGLELRSSEDVRSGFRISFDGGKSHFDFTERELADYISAYLKPALRDILDADNENVKP